MFKDRVGGDAHREQTFSMPLKRRAGSKYRDGTTPAPKNNTSSILVLKYTIRIDYTMHDPAPDLWHDVIPLCRLEVSDLNRQIKLSPIIPVSASLLEPGSADMTHEFLYIRRYF